MVDTSFLVTLGIIFVVAMVGSYLSSRRRDPCLKDLDGFHVTVEKKNGRIIWGNMHLYPTGIELEYTTNVQDQAHVETTYIMYKEEFKDVQGFYRYADELTPQKQALRERELRRSFHPGVLSVLSRRIRNFVNTASDSLAEAFAYVTGQARQKQPTAALSETGEAYLKKLGKDIIGQVGASFDPLLEQYVGAKVVVEVLEGESIHEYVGVLKEYSSTFVEVLDVLYPESLSISLSTKEERDKLAQNIRITFDGAFQIKNLSEYPLLLHEISCGDREGEINAVIGPGDAVEVQPLALTAARSPDDEDLSVFFEGLSSDEEDAQTAATPFEDADADGVDDKFEEALQSLSACGTEAPSVQFDFRIIRLLDMVVPRAHSLVRHKAERYDPDQVFGSFSIALPFRGRAQDLEQDYRKTLRQNPNDASSAFGLAKILIQRTEFEEAAVFLQMALDHRDQLIDQGRLADLQLGFVRKKLETRGGKSLV